MFPEGMTPEAARTAYAELVVKVKAEFGKKEPRKFSGEQVSHEIQKRWAKRCRASFDAPKPKAPDGSEAVATKVDHSTRGVPTMEVEGHEEPFEVPVPATPSKD